MSANAIRTAQLCRSFGNVTALDNLSLEVPQGIVFGFLGANGSGKTTTIRLLLGILEPTAGQAEVLGFDCRTHSHAIRQRTGALLEHPGLYERLSAEDNLEFYARAWRIPTAKRRSRIQELLSHMGLWQRRHQRVGEWSRGMKQKLAIARAMLHSPPLIFLDEPTIGLDPVAAAALRDNIQEMVAQEGVTVFLTTHNLAEAEKLCQQVGVIRQGKLLAVGHPERLRSQAGNPKLEIIGRGFTANALDWLESQPLIAEIDISKINNESDRLTISLHQLISSAPIVKMLVQAGVEVEEVRKVSPTLEEVFLSLMEQ
ncbi:ABC transporter ATP-binding protein [Chroococcidiopsis sp. CCNUC1]|uniref:ABC transporter ATP-binding protein n=1 Tax=Chroococcidiopsis sp. CCNUC1 TaxID=2653189 RepID=UPI002022962D|nr:ABC transporter ATP-binding protein [Chroococcidiopsis sp. CCNUC1]URD52993.1 ABC transporter ATP-binding protein [Chroococcidiopsis sp. CCNUC1]